MVKKGSPPQNKISSALLLKIKDLSRQLRRLLLLVSARNYCCILYDDLRVSVYRCGTLQKE